MGKNLLRSFVSMNNSSFPQHMQNATHRRLALARLLHQPLDDLVDIYESQRRDWDDEPWVVHDVVQVELPNQFGFRDVRFQIDFVGKH